MRETRSGILAGGAPISGRAVVTVDGLTATITDDPGTLLDTWQLTTEPIGHRGGWLLTTAGFTVLLRSCTDC